MWNIALESDHAVGWPSPFVAVTEYSNLSTKALVVLSPPHPPLTPKIDGSIEPPIGAWTIKVPPPQDWLFKPSNCTTKINSFWAPFVLLSARNNSSYADPLPFPSVVFNEYELEITFSALAITWELISEPI